MKINMARFQVGTVFNTFQKLEEIKAFEQESFVNLVKRHSRSIQNAIKRGSNKSFNPDIVFAEINFVCKHGCSYKPRNNKDERKNTRTEKMECPFVLKFKATSDGQGLAVVHLNNDHNHEVSQIEFQFAPKQRIVDKTAQKDIADMVALNANRKKIQQMYSEKTGKAILMKDIHNIATRAKQQKKVDSGTTTCSSPDRVKNLSEWIKSQFPALHTTFVQDEEGVVLGIFMQDNEMCSAFDRFPEVLLIDATHKTNDQGMPLYTIINIDGNGESQVVAAFLVQTESEPTLRSMTKVFKEQNSKWEDVKVILTDKDMVERGVFKSEMPQVSMEICLFHVLRTFGREITVEKMGVTLGEKATILDKIQELAYSWSEESYQSQYDSLCEVMPDIVCTYYDRNWHPIRHEWVDGLKHTMNLCTRTNNRIESFFKHLKSYITTRGSIEDLIEGFISVLSILRNERSFRLLKSLSTLPTKPVSAIEAEYQRYVTAYALTQIQEQLKYSTKVTIINDTTVETSSGHRTVDESGCSCAFFMHMRLSCRHMFAIKRFKDENLFMPEITAKRWTIEYYKSHRYISDSRPRLSIAVQKTLKPKAISENQKWKDAGEVFQVAQSILSKCGMEQYKARLACVQKLISLWQEDKEAFVGEFVATDISDETPDESRTDENESRNSTFGLPNLPEPHEDLPDLMELENKSIEPEEQPAPAQPDTQPTSVESEEQPATVQPDDQPTSPDLQGVRFAPVPRKRGRPKGACTTAIGLPLKRIKKANNSKTPDHRKSSAEKGRMLLSFLCQLTYQSADIMSSLCGVGVRVRVNNFFSKTTRPRDMMFFLKDTLSIEDEKLFKACKSVCSSVC